MIRSEKANKTKKRGLSPVTEANGGAGRSRRLVITALTLCAFTLLSGCFGASQQQNNGGGNMAKGPVVFFGDSITFMGDWQRYFPDIEAINLGVSGDRVEHLIDRADEVIAAEPAKLFIMVGVNDLLSGYTIEETLASFGRMLDLMPDCSVYVQSVLPVDSRFGERAELIPVYNARLAALCAERGIVYIDLYPLFDDGTGHIAERYTRDGLHLNAEAYKLWVKEIKALVEGGQR